MYTYIRAGTSREDVKFPKKYFHSPLATPEHKQTGGVVSIVGALCAIGTARARAGALCAAAPRCDVGSAAASAASRSPLAPPAPAATPPARRHNAQLTRSRTRRQRHGVLSPSGRHSGSGRERGLGAGSTYYDITFRYRLPDRYAAALGIAVSSGVAPQVLYRPVQQAHA
ncbi:hypothetical protein EVAR_7867_1 [Eumeta japonica]|uniref:Uncharacterized protein n=1 Tax=Eumeta variegata TaxID=151549 RepID=A0A4C1TVG4_EUMVA|nr:hypothetical protein EVAR_7867_1 [Eumeta japonica]